LSATVADARFAKPIDCELITRLVHEHPVVITIEEGSIGGFATQVMMFLAAEGLLSNGTIVRPMYLPDRFVAHGAPGEQYEDAGLTARHIVAEVFTALKLDRKAAVLKAKA
jgi:1-deoxy-D-xylulose-5-phosphate synthase